MNGEQVKASGDGSPLKVDGPTLIHNESMTSALLKKGARPWVTDLQINGTAFNAISWSAATLTFANGDTVTINAGSATSIATGTHYMYLNGVSGSVTPLLTTTHGTAIGDAKILLATVTVSSATDGTKPTIFPFNGKYPTLSAVVLAADLIIADHIRTNTIGTDRLTVSARGEISEKTITTVSNSAPTSPTPRTGDIWFDTSGSITVIKVYDATTSPYWIVRNANAPEGGGATIFYAATSSPPTSEAVNDIWYATDTDIAYIAVTHPATSIQTSTQWVKQDVVTAINSGSTEIKGGLINTAKIILTANGANILETGVGVSPSAPRIEISNTEIVGYSSAGESNKEFYITSAQGKAYFGGGQVICDSGGLTLGTAGSGSTDSFLRFNSAVSGSTANFLMTAYIDNLLILFGPGNSSSGHGFLPGVGASYGNLGHNSYRWHEAHLGPTSGSSPGTEGLYLSGTLLRNNAGALEWNNASVVGGLASGSNTAPTLNFSSDTTSGLYYVSTGSYKGVGISGNGNMIASFWSDDTTDFMSMGAHIEMNNHNIVEIFDLNTAGTPCNYVYAKNIYAESLISNNATYDIRQTASGYFYKYSSSRRFKENIIDLDFDSSKIYSLMPHTFKWKDFIEDKISIEGQSDFGYIAEEVHELLPQLVGYDTFGGDENLPASVHYNQITVLLVEELKKLKARIDILEGV
jgi:hypothetical protein